VSPRDDASRSYVPGSKPWVPVLAIIAVEFPVLAVFSGFAAPALGPGNAGILKQRSHGAALVPSRSKRVPGRRLPGSLFRAVFLSNEAAAGVIAARCARDAHWLDARGPGAEQAARHLKRRRCSSSRQRSVLVLEDADLERAGEQRWKRVSSTAARVASRQRFIVLERVAERFLERFHERHARPEGWGDPPSDPATQVGPQARLDLRENPIGRCKESVKGAPDSCSVARSPPAGGLLPAHRAQRRGARDARVRSGDIRPRGGLIRVKDGRRDPIANAVALRMAGADRRAEPVSPG